jgi:hypothetical protein
MNTRCLLIAIVVVALVLVSPVIVQSGPRSHPLDEDAALALLDRTLKHDHVYENRISLDCVMYMTEETTDAYFQFVLREKHNAKCGGAPETAPVVDRYRVYRSSGKIKQWKAAEDKWEPYKSAQTK